MTTTIEHPRNVTLVVRDPRRALLLAAYLRAHGWLVTEADDGRRVLRQWTAEKRTPFLVLDLDESDPDGFELLAAIAAHALESRVVVCLRHAELSELRSLGVERVIGAPGRFADILAALEAMHADEVTRAA